MFHVRQVNEVTGEIGASDKASELSEKVSIKSAWTWILGLLCRKIQSQSFQSQRNPLVSQQRYHSNLNYLIL